jgi:hypothetical protein
MVLAESAEEIVRAGIGEFSVEAFKRTARLAIGSSFLAVGLANLVLALAVFDAASLFLIAANGMNGNE